MRKSNCPKVAKKLIIFSIIFLFAGVLPGGVFAVTNNVINFQGKIVRNDTGYEGLNVITGTPSCVVAGAGNDTCDFRIRYYDASTSGTLLLTETFSNTEIGAYNGAFDLSLGSTTPTAGSYATFDAMIKGENTIYVELGFDPAGGGSFTETFTRMPLGASAFAIRAKYAAQASTAFQFDTAADGTGYSTPTEGMVFYDSDDDVLMVYDGSTWGEVGGGGTGSLFTDGGIFTYLTSLTDHFVLGTNSYTAIGSDSYSTYMSGLGSRSPFSFDMTAERLTLSGSAVNSGLTVYSDYNSTGAWPVVSFKAEDSGFDNVVLEITQDGTGNLMSLKKGSTDAFVFENALTMYMRQRPDAPSTTTDRLYNINGTLYWNGAPVSTGGNLWTDGGTFTYLTSTTDDVIIGGDSALNAKFFFDVSTGNFGIGTSTPGAKLDIAGASSTISNTTGDITITPDDTVVIKANDTETDNLMEWQNSSATILSLINQNGYATFGKATGNTGAMLTLGANTTSVAQLNLNASAAVDVAAPASGDMWWNGTNLYFYDGTANVDLLAGGTGTGGALFSGYGSISSGGYLNVQHDSDTYDVVADGWICVGGTNNETCTGGNWKSIKDSSVTVGHYLSNEWNKADPDGVIRSQVRLTDVELAPGIDVGTGADGDITVSSNTVINTTNLISGRSCADGGDAVNYNITAFNAGGTEATLSSTPSTGCLSAGDEVLIINLQGTSTAYGNVGNYETLEVLSVSGTTVTFKTPKINYYGDTTSGDTNLGTTAGSQRVMLQRVPNYNDVTVNSSMTFSPSAWNGAKGGVIFFRANGAVSVSGSITTSSLGYRGGVARTNDYGRAGGDGGEAFSGLGGTGGTSAFTTGGNGAAGGGAGVTTGGVPGVAGNGITGGGGGTYTGGTPGTGSATSGGSGGGGGAHHGGGGGGYGTGYATNASSNGSTSLGGNGGTYGESSLSKLYFGSAGGGGGNWNATVDGGGAGANGGGIIYVGATSLTVSGSIVSNGATGSNGYTCASGRYNGGGGGGAGGSIYLQANSAVLGSSLVGVNGGSGGSGCSTGTLTYYGGAGGLGRIVVSYASSYSGSTANASVTSYTSVGYNSYGIYNSPVIATRSAQSYDNLRWTESLDTYGNISIQTRSGNSTDSTDGTWEAWKPSTASTNYLVLQNADTHTAWTGTNATVAEGDVTRNIDFFEDEDEGTATNVTKITSSTSGGYAEATISSTDLSGYDYATVWVRASQTGNTLRLGMGESVATEIYQDITVDAADTWQKVYLDISAIASASRDGITKLRLTNQSSTSNTIYLDNVKAEELLTDNDGSVIASTPNNYLQYRVIFTTTNLAYYPRLENISISYNTGYRVVVQDNNNVRLYNYSGATQYLKLTVALSGGENAGTLAYVNLAPSSAQVDSANDTNSIWINKTGTGGNLIRMQESGSDMFVVDSAGNATFGGGSSGNVTLTLGEGIGYQGGIRYNATSDHLEFYIDGGWMPLGDYTNTVTLSAEYPGAVLSADGSSNSGAMTSDSEGTASDSMNYYEWSSAETSLNDYDIRVRFTLPADFNAWGSGWVVFNYATEATGTTNNKLDFYVYEEGSATVDGSSTGQASGTAGVWNTATISGSGLDECTGAGTTCMFVIKMSSANDSYARVGDIQIIYNRSL